MAKIKVSQSIRDFVGSHDDLKHSTIITTYTDYTVEIIQRILYNTFKNFCLQGFVP